MFGREWSFIWQSTKAFEASLSRGEARVVLTAGILLTAMTGGLLLSLSTREAMAMTLFRTKERELYAQENLNASIVDTATVGILSTDADGHILRMSASAETLFGVGREHALGQSVGMLLPNVADDIRNASASHGEVPIRIAEVRTPAGRKLILDVRASFWRTVDNELRATVVVADVTDRTNEENLLEETRRRLDTALQGAQIGVFENDLETRHSVVSGTWKRLMGFDDDAELDAQAEWLSRIEPADLPIVQAADLACVKGELPRSISQYRIRVASGAWRWMKSDAVISKRAPDGRAVQMTGTQTDVTELVEMQMALNESEAALRDVVERAPVGMAIVEPDGRMLSANGALAQFLGRSKEELPGMSIDTVTHPDDVLADQDQIRKLIANAIGSYHCEKRYLRPDGSVVWGLLGASKARTWRGTRDARIMQVQDITELKAVERLKSDFVATVSHELRTPLTSIKGALGIVIGTMQDQLPAQAAHLLSIAGKNCERLIYLVNDILDMERLSADQATFVFGREDARACVADSVAASQPIAHHHGVDLRVDLPDCGLFVNVDPGRLHQVVTNLVSNAIKHSSRGQTVVVAVRLSGGMVQISVIDNGPGIPSTFRRKMFKPFMQVDMSSTRKVGGTGLGLSICKGIVDRMGGAIDYASVPGVETTFTVEFPLIEAE